MSKVFRLSRWGLLGAYVLYAKILKMYKSCEYYHDMSLRNIMLKLNKNEEIILEYV